MSSTRPLLRTTVIIGVLLLVVACAGVSTANAQSQVDLSVLKSGPATAAPNSTINGHQSADKGMKSIKHQESNMSRIITLVGIHIAGGMPDNENQRGHPTSLAPWPCVLTRATTFPNGEAGAAAP